ncbi:MAG: type II and III secretion system protein [Rhodospirillales bacterium]|nr:type II and III secretion system protein [Rhodospirillales bacterium]
MANVGGNEAGKVRRGLARTVLAGSLTFLLVGCPSYDRYGGLSKDEYRALMDRRGPEEARPREAPPIPDLQPILAAPLSPASLESRLVSLQVTDTVSLRDVLLELTRKVGVDLEMDTAIQGGIIFSAYERPFTQVIDRIAELAGLRYQLKDGVLRVEIDNMYHQSYRVDAINLVRTSKSNVATNTNVFAAVSGGSGGGTGNTSSSSVDGTSEADLWKELTANIQQIVTNSDPRNRPNLSRTIATSAGTSSSTASATATAAPTPEAAPQTPVTSAPTALTPATTGSTANPVAAAAQIAQATTAAVNQATGASATATPASGGTTGGGTAARSTTAAAATATPAPATPTSTTQSFFSVNKQAGIISVFGTQRQHRLVRTYLEMVKRSVSSQVLIEAKVLEVTLSDAHKTGINWRTVGGWNVNAAQPLGISSTSSTGATTTTLPTVGPPFTTFNTATSNFLTVGFLNKRLDLNVLASLIQEFGTVRTLSSPRLTAMNNQTAVLKVAENEVYFRVDIQTTTNNGVSQTTYSSTMNTVPIGLVLTVQPSINLDTEEIALGLRPTISRIARRVNDPAVDLQAAAAGSSVTSAVPVVEVREMDSVVTVPSGQVVVMGGLMQERIQKNTTGVPGAQDLPLFGNLFKANADQLTLTELVILLRATVVHAGDSIAPADRDLYTRFTRDPRPLAF